MNCGKLRKSLKPLRGHEGKLMKRFLLTYCIFVNIFVGHGFIYSHQHHAIVYNIESWRRLGDAITTVCKTFYFSQVFDLPIYFRNFPYFDQFALSHGAKIITPEIEKKFSKKIIIKKETDISENINSKESILFECHFLSETPSIYLLTRKYPEFELLVKNAFRPLVEIPSLPKPPAVITVGLHVRKGGGFDRPLKSKQEYEATHSLPKGFYIKKCAPNGSHEDIWPLKWPIGPMYIESVKKYIHKKTNFSDYIWPVKFPCDQYYIDQLKELTTIMPTKNFLVYLFTDDPEPEKIMERYAAQLTRYPRIIFSYRQSNNHHTKNVIEDLFALAECDCLISASSSFASAAQLLGKHQVLMFPIWAVTFPDKIVISKVGIITLDQSEETPRRLNYRETFHNIT